MRRSYLYHAGSSLLASGPLTASLIAERVVGLLAEYQGSLLGHLNEWDIAKQHIIDSRMGAAPDFKGFAIKPDMSSVIVMGDDVPSRDYCLDRLLAPFPNRVKRELSSQPLVYVTGATPAELRRNLQRSHFGRPLVHEVLRSPAHCAELEDCCLPVIDGCLTSGPRAMPVHGHVLLGDPSRVLGEVLRTGGEAGRWLLRLPWLVDGNAGPEPPASQASGDTRPKLDRMEQRYQHAMRRAWRCRLDHQNPAPELHALDIAAEQAGWVAFLLQHERSLPGISAAARPLLATLVFGLYEMVKCLPLPEGCRFELRDAVSLAGFLVQRMTNARAVIVHAGERETARRKQQGILDKLAAGPLSTRDLGRRFHRMTTTECRDLLLDLGKLGRVIELPGDRWQLAMDTVHAERPNLVLNV